MEQEASFDTVKTDFYTAHLTHFDLASAEPLSPQRFGRDARRCYAFSIHREPEVLYLRAGHMIFLVDGKEIELFGQQPCFHLVPRPTEHSAVQTLVEKKKTVSLPQKSLDTVSASAAEQVQTFIERIQGQRSLYHRGESLYAFSQIAVSGNKIDRGI